MASSFYTPRMLWRAFAKSVSDQLWDAPSAEARFLVLERALLVRARGRFDRHPVVMRAVALFDRSHGAPKRYCRVSGAFQS
jgi:hypothetical protein